MRRASRVQTVLMLLVVVAASVAVGAGTATSKQSAPHCFSPAGEDLNAVFMTRDALVTPFCDSVRVGDRWRPLLRIQVAGGDFVFPAGYAPSSTDLTADFLAKLVSVRVVVDADTKRERTYRFSADELLRQIGTLPDGSRFVRLATPSLHPLPPGAHSVDVYVTLRADFWDGLGVDPALNLIPQGESLTPPLQLRVVKRR